ncbi:MAG: hypothetical protein GKR89_06250 [Candidatus Latescibacteria bacterium]|nr:hypothetical protein [Candidatus Latescibacterota bacterium]
MQRSITALLRGTVFALGFFAYGCGDDDDGHSSTVTLSLEHQVDGAALVLDDQLRHVNAAGNEYSVSKVEYILTGIALEKANGQRVVLADQHYRNAADEATQTVAGAEIAAGDYERLVFTFGVTGEENVAGALPNAAVYENMLWPEAMGGGYHYMKFEGLYRAGDEDGAFAVHTGPSGGNDFSLAIVLPIDLKADGDDWTIRLSMNLNEWFTGAETYDFAGLGGIMGNAGLQAVLQGNGAGAFSIDGVEAAGKRVSAGLLSP